MRNKKMKIFILFLFVLGGCLFYACPSQTEQKKTVEIRFSFMVDDVPIETGKMQYQNAAGNEYQVDELKFFISDFLFYTSGKVVAVQSDESIHYVDYALPNTHRWILKDDFLSGNYDSLSFIFGLNAEKNISHRFTDSPEKDMAWPEVLGGGYHYMQMNGKWKNQEGIIIPYNLHTGIGQINIQKESQLIHNFVRLSLPLSHFIVYDNEMNVPIIFIEININQLFTNPELFDFNIIGGSIMQNQEVQNLLKKNAWNIFSVK